MNQNALGAMAIVFLIGYAIAIWGIGGGEPLYGAGGVNGKIHFTAKCQKFAEHEVAQLHGKVPDFGHFQCLKAKLAACDEGINPTQVLCTLVDGNEKF